MRFPRNHPKARSMDLNTSDEGCLIMYVFLKKESVLTDIGGVLSKCRLHGTDDRVLAVAHDLVRDEKSLLWRKDVTLNASQRRCVTHAVNYGEAGQKLMMDAINTFDVPQIENIDRLVDSPVVRLCVKGDDFHSHQLEDLLFLCPGSVCFQQRWRDPTRQ